jgi:putative GTP pyrophosphokinase
MKAKVKVETSADDYWRDSPELIKTFLEQSERYKQLCSEIEYILCKQITSKGIEIAHTTSRAKTLNSFLEKLYRKPYENPFEEITDFAGVRIVCLYRSDLAQLEEIVCNEFQLVEKVDKLRHMSPNEFGYGAIHYIVKLSGKTRGARYDDLKDLVCEVQIRTVLQDAWAIIDHHLVYKQESDVPSVLIRKLNGLSGLFETADDSFNTIRKEREIYLEEVKKSSGNDETFLKNELNKDTLISFVQWKFPKLSPFSTSVQVGSSLKAIRAINNLDIETLGDLNAEYEKVASKADGLYELLSLKYRNTRNGCMRLKYSLALIHDEILDTQGSPKEWVKITREYKTKSSNKSLQRTAKKRRR